MLKMKLPIAYMTCHTVEWKYDSVHGVYDEIKLQMRLIVSEANRRASASFLTDVVGNR